MSFETLKLSELKQVAEDFGVDASSLKGKADVVAALIEDGVTWEVYSKAIKDVQEAKEEVEILPQIDLNQLADPNSLLVKMERDNYRYDALGFTFTKEHPFVAMSSESAQEIFDKEEGFRLATPREVQDFYS